MNTYTHKPHTITAIQYTGDNEQEIIDALGPIEFTKVVDEAEVRFRESPGGSGFPTFTAEVSGAAGSKAGRGTYSFQSGWWLVREDKDGHTFWSTMSDSSFRKSYH